MDVLVRIRQTHSATDLPIIMATQLSDATDIVAALRAGANDYVTKPVDYSVMLARVRTQLALKRSVDEIQRLKKNLEVANKRMKRDLDTAAKVQAALLPHSLRTPPGVDFAWKFQPCSELAGDLLNVIPLDENRVAVYVLDVVGHGAAAAMLASMVSRMLMGYLRDGPASWRPSGLRELSEQLNHDFPFDLYTSQYFTLVFGFVDLANNSFRFISAGHPGPAHLPESAEPLNLRIPSAPVGLAEKPYEEQVLSMNPGDRLYLYSDGVIEAMDEARQQYGVSRMLAKLDEGRKLSLDDSLSSLTSSVQTWCGTRPPHDDISILAIERTAPV